MTPAQPDGRLPRLAPRETPPPGDGLPDQTRACLGLALGSALAYLLLFLLRHLDDNRLLSWDWVLSPGQAAWFMSATLASLALAWLLSAHAPPPRLAPWLLALGFAAALLPLWSIPEVVLDAARYFTYAAYATEQGVGGLLAAWGAELPVWSDLPAAPLLLGLLVSWLGEERWVWQALNGALYLGAALALRDLGRRLWSREVGDGAAILLAALPYALAQTPLLLVDLASLAFLTFSLAALAWAGRGGGWGAAGLAGAACGLALLAKYSLWPLLGLTPLLVWAWGQDRRGRRGQVLGLLLGAGLGAAFLLAKQEVVAEQIGLLWGYQRAGLGRWGESLFPTFFFQVHPLLSLAALYSLWRGARRRDRAYLPLAALAGLALFLGGNRSRYLLPALPIMALMAAYGLQDLPWPRARRLAPLAAALPSLALTLLFHQPFLEGVSLVNLGQAGQYLNNLGVERVLVVSAPAAEDLYDPAVCLPLLDIYARAGLCYDQALWRRPPGRDRLASSLRFTWEYRPPARHACAEEPGRPAQALLLIHDGAPLPPQVAQALAGWRLAKSLETDNGVFALKTLVGVYLPEGAAGKRGAQE